jgi:Pro-kumamolisin, activation domain
MPPSRRRPAPTEPPANYRRLEGSERKPRVGTRRVRAARANETLSVTICVRRHPDAPRLPDQDYWRRNPPGRRRYLTEDDFRTTFAAADADLARVEEFARSNELTVERTDAAQRIVVVSGTVAKMNRAFQVDLGQYESDDEHYRGREGFVYLPEDLLELVEGVFGLDNRRMAKRALGFDANTSLTPIQVAQDYNFPATRAADQTIGVLEFGDSVVGPVGYTASDIDEYFTTAKGIGPGLQTPALKDVGVNGATNSPSPGVESDIENTIDICVAGAVAQGAAINVYFTTWDENGWIQVLKEVVHPTQGETQPAVLSISWDSPEFESSGNLSWTAQAMAQVSGMFQEAASAGITVLVAAGDYGSDCGVGNGEAHVFYPASDPWIVSCGGTEIGTENGGYAEHTWPDTGGGISQNFPLPAWQRGIGVPTSVNPPHNPGRGIPDIAGYANGYSIVFESATIGPIAGTSETAPLYAGLIATINEILGERIGYLTPTLYWLATNPATAWLFREIDDGVENGQNGAPGYRSTPGWNAVNGWGVLDGAALLSLLRPLFQKSLGFILDRSTFGEDEVMATPAGTFSQALLVVVDGLTPSDFPNGGIKTLTPSAAQLAQWAPSIPSPVAPGGPTNIEITPTGVASDDPSLGPEVQQFTFTYEVVFPDLSAFGSAPETLTITASLTGVPSVSAVIELIKAANPFFSSESHGGSPILSEDLRVFNQEEGSTLFGAQPLGSTPESALSFIQWIIQNISGPLGTGPNGDTFEALPTLEAGSALSLLPTTLPLPFESTKAVFNFALARVRLTGTTPADAAKTVRVFFRLCQCQVTTTQYEQPAAAAGSSPATGFYRQWSDGVVDGQKIALLGISADGSEYVDVPFFAHQRVTNDSAATNMETQMDPLNVQTIAPVAGSTTYAYFGAWLDTNQSQQLLPYQPGADPDGPFSGQSLYTIGQVLTRGGHQCLVAEIVDDTAPIPDGSTTSSSDKLAQRNVAFTVVANPGLPSSRAATHTFDIRPTPAYVHGERPDELMIDWRNVPRNSTASIYLPGVEASEVLALAASMYTIRDLEASDPHTLECSVGGITYVPIPTGDGVNFAGLLTVNLPAGIHSGEQFEVVVRQITSLLHEEALHDPAPAESTARLASTRTRFVYGAFQLVIPVSTRSAMLVPEERTLSVMRWIQESIPATSRWYPVFQRYLGQLAERVSALGGNPNTIPPTQNGLWPGLGAHPRPGGAAPPALPLGDATVIGKIESIIYDHFGDFEAFRLITATGQLHRFESREQAVLRIVQRAWEERIAVAVTFHPHQPEHPLEISLLAR